MLSRLANQADDESPLGHTIAFQVDAIKARILQLCGERNITINKLATMSALPPSSVKNILYGKSSDPKIRTLKKLCDGLDLSLAEFFSTPEFETLEQEIK